MKEGLANKPALVKTKACCLISRKEKVTMNMKDMNYPLDMIFINMSKEVVAVRSLKPGNFETSVEGVRFVLEVNKDEGAGLGELISCTSDLLSAVGMAEETEAPLVDAETEEEEEAEESKHDTY
jgi:hypothetical protein